MARVCAIADFFDAITTKRSYADPLNIPDALALMTKSSGKKIDPKIFNAFSALTMVKYERDHCKHALPENFDPCQPNAQGFLALDEKHSDHEVLQAAQNPVVSPLPQATAKAQTNGKVMLMDPVKHRPNPTPAKSALATKSVTVTKTTSRIFKKSS